MRAIVIGAVESTKATLAALGASPGWQVEAVVTLPAELAARHSDFVDLRPAAVSAGARLITAARVNARAVVEEIRSLEPDYMFVIGWSQICGPSLLAAATRGAIGYHPAPLPRLRGRAVIPWTILLDEKITASTLFWIDSGVDTGPILAQRFFHVAPDETAGTLYDRHMAALVEMLEETLASLVSGIAPRITQDERFATWCAKRTPEDGLIDWRRPAGEVWRLIRAVSLPYPGAFTYSQGRRLTVWQARPWQEGGCTRHAAAAGQVVARSDGLFAARCGDGQDLLAERFSWADGVDRPAPSLHARLGEEFRV